MTWETLPRLEKLVLRPLKNDLREFSLNIQHYALSLRNIFPPSKLTVFANERRLEDSNSIKERWSLLKEEGREHIAQVFFIFPQTKCKSKEITGASVKSPSDDVPSYCPSEPHRHTEGGRKKVIYTYLQNLIFL